MRRTLTEIAMIGVGDSVEVIRQSAESIKEALAEDGVMRIKIDSPYQKRRNIECLRYSNPYIKLVWRPIIRTIDQFGVI